MNIVSHKINIPPLVRKMPVVRDNIIIKVNTNNNSKTTLKTTKQPIVQTPRTNIKSAPPAVKRSAPQIAKPNEIKFQRRKPLTYTSPEVSPDNIPKILNLRNRGMGRLLAIIGNGPSVNEVDLEELNFIEQIDTFSINTPDPRIWPTTYWSFYDPSQIRRHKELIETYEGIKFISHSINIVEEKAIKFKNIHGHHFCKDLTKGLCISRSSCYAAMQIALWMNYEKIFLFGVDMNPEGLNGQLHFYGTNPDVKPDIRKTRFESEAKYYDHAGEILSEQDRGRFYFCSSYNRWSFLNHFNYMGHKDAIGFIKSCI